MIERKPESLIPIYLETDGTTPTARFPIRSQWWTNVPTHIQLDRGVKLKLWEIQAGGLVETRVFIELSYDEGKTWEQLKPVILISPGQLSIIKQRPVVIDPLDRKVPLISFRWEQPTPGYAWVEILAEFESLDD